MTGFTLGTTDGATLGTTNGGTLGDANPDSTFFQVTRDATTIEDAVFDVDPVVDTANPFGDYCVVKMDDRGGVKFEQYPRGTRLDVGIMLPGATQPIELFTGYVVERRETEQQGADVLEVEAYTFDQFLRRNTVTNDQTGNLISEALADIITVDTPVSYVEGNVDVGDDQELTRGYQGVSVEETLRDLAFKSNNEEFGVNDSLEFFFRPQETTHIDRGIDNTQWFNYDIPELGKEAINEVEVWFNGGDESVIVDDGTDKLDLQDSLGLPSPGTQRHELNRPLITDIGDAEDIGRKYLAFRNSTLSGTVTTYGLYEASPGDTISITIDPRGIDTEFLIAATEYRWGRDQTILTVVEKRGDVDDILTELNDSVQRVEMNGADRDAPSNRITTTQANAIVDVSVDADGNTPSGVRFVNDGRRAVRDAWTGDTPPTIDTIAVGSDGGALSRSNTSLNNQSNSASATETLPDSTSAEYSASITQTAVEEIGLLTASGTLIARAVFDSPVDLAGSVTVTLDVSNDDSVSRGVLTAGGQTAVRDCLADNSPAVPDAYAYGSDNTPVSEGDTALGNELVETSLTEILIQNADTQSDWEGIWPTPPATTTLQLAGGILGSTQVCFFNEGENADRLKTGFDDGSSDTNISNAAYISLSRDAAVDSGGDADFAEWDFTPQHTIPAADFSVYVRHGSNTDGAPGLQWILEHANGTNYVLDESTSPGVGLAGIAWVELPVFSSPAPDTVDADLEAGTTHTLRCVITDSGGSLDQYQYWIDCVAPIDGRYVSDVTFGETTDANDTLVGPEKYPSLVETSLATASTRRNVTQANYSLTANDVSNQFYVELANDGTTYTRVDNASSGSVTFASPDRGVDTNIGLSRYAADATSTPREGDSGQAIDVWSLFANPDAVLTDNIGETVTRAVVPPNTSGIVGETVREAGLIGDSTLLTRHILAEFLLETGQRLASAESTTFTGNN